MTYLLRLVACLFLCVSLNSFGAISYSGVVSDIDDPSGVLSSDLGFNNLQVGDSYSASFNFGSPTVYSSFQSELSPDYQLYMIDDPSYSASITFSGQPTINSVPAQGNNFFTVFSNVYVGLAQDTLIEKGVGDAYILQAEVTDNVWMVFHLGDSTGTALSSTDFYAESSLDNWDITSVYLQHVEFNPSYTDLGLLVSTNEVPLPAGITLFLSALVGLGFVKGKKV